MGGNFPNPFNATTAISFKLQTPGHVSLRVYDTAGKLVATLEDGWLEAGTHEALFDASKLPSGIYFYRIQAAGFQATSKMLLLK
jgi:flagellar hook assembly protein FlgD